MSVTSQFIIFIFMPSVSNKSLFDDNYIYKNSENQMFVVKLSLNIAT